MTTCRSPGLMTVCQCARLLLGKMNSPKNACGAKGDRKKAVSSIGGEDDLLGLCLGFVVGIERFIRKWDALVDIHKIQAIEDHTGRTGVNKFRNFIFLGGSN